MNTTSIEFAAKVKAFSSERGAREHRISIDPTGTVRVWDAVARHYTTCHSMSDRTQARLREMAKSI